MSLHVVYRTLISGFHKWTRLEKYGNVRLTFLCPCLLSPLPLIPQALEYLLKFIIQSRILYSRATCGMEEEQFRASIQELFQSIRFVLSLDSRSSETLVFTQVSDLNTLQRSKHSDTQQGLGDLHWPHLQCNNRIVTVIASSLRHG